MNNHAAHPTILARKRKSLLLLLSSVPALLLFALYTSYQSHSHPSVYWTPSTPGRPHGLGSALLKSRSISRRALSNEPGFNRAASASSTSFPSALRLFAGSILGASLLACSLSSSSTILLDDQPPLLKGGLRTIPAREILTHSTEESCWVVIEGQVWDVTEYLSHHPGGKAVILSQAGHDATDLFKPIHPAGTLASKLPPSCLVGTVDTATGYQLLAGNNEGEVTEEDRAERRLSLPSVDKIINLNEFETMAQRVLGEDSKAYKFYASVAEDGVAFKHNMSSFSYLRFRPRILVPVEEVSTETSLLPSISPSPLPIFISPASRAGTGHPDAEKTLVRGAAVRNIVHCISSAASLGLGEILAERRRVGGKAPVWFQLYVGRNKKEVEQKVRDAVEGGCTAIVLTVDLACQGKREDDRTKLGLGQKTSWLLPFDGNLDWTYIPWLQSLAPGVPLLLKGVATPEDAVLAYKAGCSGVILSNHGGRQLDHAPPPLETLIRIRQQHPELLAKDLEFSVMIDGGVRRGSDVIKALCLGARGVGLGRPFLFAQTAYAEQGVVRAIEILEQELQVTMRLIGASSIADLKPEMVGLLDGLLAKDI
ncbi:hypothetical protein BDY24DRAFT_418530 [Mrakia frigida]|uniref:FMN-dependent alpha-hydroxy acid dehydrogenase family protein n=1 Tax=Mrakia frigida TaxID=29902 RepID=UPI003FCC09A0